MRKFLLALFAFGYFTLAFAQAPKSWTSAEIYQGIEKLNVLGSVLYVAAHPDDENTRLIAYLSKDRLYRTGYLALTRGDGGQNLIGDEQGIELGLIRTQELLAARRVDGGEQFFTRAFDFGFSKGPDETFTKWDREKILSDVVWVIRKFQPDVIITRFPITGEGGHGHHTASAILANEAFTAAADPNRFPEQLKYVKPWQAKRVLLNGFNFGGVNTIREDQLKIDVGGYNPLLGKSYGEISAESRSNHKSQGFGSASARGEALEYFATTKGSAPKNDLMDEVDVSWKRVKGGEAIAKMVDKLKSSFSLSHPENAVQELVNIYRAIAALEDGYWKEQKLKEVKELIIQCSGLFLEATSAVQFAVQTDSVRINFSFNNRLGAGVILKGVKMDDFDTSFSRPMGKNANLNFSKTFFVPSSKPLTQPYWLVNKMEEGYFNVSDQQKIGQPDVDPAYTVTVRLNIAGEDFTFPVAVKYKYTDPVKGEIYQPLVVVPTMVVSPDAHVKISKNNNSFEGVLNITSKKQNAYIKPVVAFDAVPKGVKIEVSPESVIANERNKTYEVSYKIRADEDGRYNFGAKDSLSNTASVSNMHEIAYDHIPYITYFTEADVINTKIDLKTENKKIGYIVGAGDKVPAALEQMGYEVILLTEKEISRNSLNQFDAIITGVRAYNTNDWLRVYYDKLMKYVNDGGNLIVQYNNTQFRGGQPKIGPYNFSVVNRRITDENAEVTFLKPDHPVLNFPNKITQNDFKGWVQERSIYHAANYDKAHYEAILSMHDPGENNDEGSLIVAKYGKGHFTYTGLVFFRELPAGVPGAYRLLANIIALNKKKAF
jgi:LmbE family N-acetylglucosaminyl deacetylase